MNSSLPLFVFCHLRWNFVFQRPQHLMTRLARQRPIYFIEEPIYDDRSRGHWVHEDVGENIRVCRPHTPVKEHGFHEAQWPFLGPMIGELASQAGWARYGVWFYTPLALPFAKDLRPEFT